MRLSWRRTSVDYVSDNHDTVFRLQRKSIDEKFDRGRKISWNVFELQAKKVNHISFKNLDYTFYIGNPKVVHPKSVNEVLWDDVEEIINESNEILISLCLISKY